jgi:hypothetical protein
MRNSVLGLAFGNGVQWIGAPERGVLGALVGHWLEIPGRVQDHRNVDADAAHREDRPGFLLLNHKAAGGVGDGSASAAVSRLKDGFSQLSRGTFPSTPRSWMPERPDRLEQAG